ncbi:hypothetical protein ACFWXH_14470 [Mesorhizobium sp. NPDC059054]|uniref:hypothetical protein n=1 Tax=unclassified Mesorhizobium TaxID=325217 RepID=UPI0006C75C86|nr:hypothetical protein [Mesorhizobium sp. 1M-11]
MDAPEVSAHPLAIDHLPSFITAPGQTDVLFNFVIVFMVVAVLATGVLYMRLHALPEHLAHRTQKVQLEIVAVLALIALFTHSRLFWIAALLLAMIDLPDFLSPLRSMSASLRRMARGPVSPSEPHAAPAETIASEVPFKAEVAAEPTLPERTTEPPAPPKDAAPREGAN